jgi:hypothetical protein
LEGGGYHEIARNELSVTRREKGETEGEPEMARDWETGKS